MRNDMDIKLNEKSAEIVSKLANSMGMTPDEVVEKIVEWYMEDCEDKK